MCRLYGFIANESTKVECSLVRAQNALLHQSRMDSRGTSHHDGWGIAYYANAHPTLERHAAAAYEDVRFDDAAESVHARIVVAHVRKATEGGVSEANTHPFQVGCWAFAHNGTIPDFAKVRPRMEAQTAPEVLQLRRGTTDSEHVFLWLLDRIRQRNPDAIDTGSHVEAIVDAMRQAIRSIERWCRDTDVGRVPRLNFILTDGRRLVASRRRNTLYWLERNDFQRCQDCDTCHCPDCGDEPDAVHQQREGYRAVVVASEPITPEGWKEVPEGHVLAIDDRLRVAIVSVS